MSRLRAGVWKTAGQTPLNPAASVTTALVQPAARDLAAAGWKLRAVSTDSGSEFRAATCASAVRQLDVDRAGRPQTNGCAERVQRTILEECWRPTFARPPVAKFTNLRRDLDGHLPYYNIDQPGKPIGLRRSLLLM